MSWPSVSKISPRRSTPRAEEAQSSTRRRTTSAIQECRGAASRDVGDQARPCHGQGSTKEARASARPCPGAKKGGRGSRAAPQAGAAGRDLTELAIRRLDAAAQSVQESSRSIEAGREAEAAEKARAAARKLESAARQVGALKARELTDRLARQRDLAQAIAKAERELGQALERERGGEGSRRPTIRRRLAGEARASWPMKSPRWRTCSSN